MLLQWRREDELLPFLSAYGPGVILSKFKEIAAGTCFVYDAIKIRYEPSEFLTSIYAAILGSDVNEPPRTPNPQRSGWWITNPIVAQ